MNASTSPLSLRELFSALKRDFAILIKQQIALAKQEAGDNLKRALLNSGFLIAGAAGVFVGLVILIFGAGFAIGQIFVAYGTAPLMGMFYGFAIVGMLLAGISAGFIFKGLHTLKERSLAPERTIETLKEDGQWAKRKFHETLS